MKPNRLTPLLTLICFASSASAEVSVTLPLQGYYRIGRSMPVTITGPVDQLTISADGAIEITATDVSDRVTVPLLVLERLGKIRTSGPGLPSTFLEPTLIPLQEGDCLVACTTEAFPFVRSMFPEKKIIRVDPILHKSLGTAKSWWGSIDLVIFDDRESAHNQLERGSEIENLLSCGTAIAVRSTEPPDAKWPWVRSGDYWVLRHEIAGPRSALVDESVYEPISAWRPGASNAKLRRTMIIAAILGIAFLGASLLSRRKMLAIFLVALVAIAALAWWQHQSSGVYSATGSIVVVDTKMVQRDTWFYQTTPVDTEVSTPELNPVFTSPEQAREMATKSTGGAEVTFNYHLRANHRFALLKRTIEPFDSGVKPEALAASPMESLARSAYLQIGDRISGILTNGNDWPTVVIERKKKD
jgi:hypothetical protein